MNLSEAYQSVYSSQEVNEAVKGQDSEMRKAAAAERAAERKAGSKAQSPGREGPSAGKSYADYQKISIDKHDKVTKKNKDVPGLVAKEEVDTFDIVFEILDEEIENALEVMSQLTFDEVQEIAEGDLAAKARAKAVEMGRKRRSSAAYKQGGARGTGKNERAAYNLSNMQNTPNADLGRQKEVDRSSGIGGHMKKALATKGKYNYRAVLDKRDPKKNPKHTANQ